MSVLAVLGTSFRRVQRDRTALFFLIVLPIVVILIVGAAERGYYSYRVGVVDLDRGAAGRALVDELAHSPNLTVHPQSSLAVEETAVRRSTVDVGVVVPAGMDARLRRGEPVTVGILAEQANNTQQAAADAVEAAVARYGGRVQAAQFASSVTRRPYAVTWRTAGRLQRTGPAIGVADVSADTSQQILPQGYSYSAPTMMVLFVFLNALAGAAIIVENRKLGMYERMLAAPVRAATVIVGEAATFAVIALGQALLIVAVGSLVFGVSWGNPLAAASLIVVWALVGAGAGMLAGTVFRTPEQASAMGPAIGIAFAMLGGCMWPLAIVSAPMRLIGHFTPQAWAVDAWTALLSRHGTVAAIAPDLGVMAAFAVGFLALASLRLRHQLTG